MERGQPHGLASHCALPRLHDPAAWSQHPCRPRPGRPRPFAQDGSSRPVEARQSRPLGEPPDRPVFAFWCVADEHSTSTGPPTPTRVTGQRGGAGGSARRPRDGDDSGPLIIGSSGSP